MGALFCCPGTGGVLQEALVPSEEQGPPPGMPSRHLWSSRERKRRRPSWEALRPGERKVRSPPARERPLLFLTRLHTFHFEGTPVDPRASLELAITPSSPEYMSLALPSRLSGILAGPTAEEPVIRSTHLTASPHANTHS